LVLIYIAAPDVNTEIADGARGGKGRSYLAGIYMHLVTCPQSRGPLPVLPLANIWARTSFVDPRGWGTEIVPHSTSGEAIRNAVQR
jgi:hypothetical protein